MSGPPRFTRDTAVDKPGIIGARWWQESLADPIPRRQALKGLLVAGGTFAALLGLGTCTAVVCSSGSSSSDATDLDVQPRRALDMQKEFGWSFGATGEPLTFDGESTLPFDRALLARMADDLAPNDPRLVPFYVRTLFEAPVSLPKSTPSGDPATFVPLKDALRPIATPAMDTAFRRGKALASLFDKRGGDVAVVVDLPGPEAVAFAAGAVGAFDVVFAFDNWPHPRGVVPAHLTLAAAAYYQPLFAKARSSDARGLPAMIVLDRNRLATYTDEATQFDNRHLAKIPGTAALGALGAKHLLYVTPADTAIELDDLNDPFVDAVASKIDVKALAVTAFEPATDTPPARSGASGAPGANGTAADAGASEPRYAYGGSFQTHEFFWHAYPWSAARPAPMPSGFGFWAAPAYEPKPRASTFSSGAAPGTSRARPQPASFGTVPVVIAIGTGLILGAKMSRNGSWNRSPGFFSGGS
jgi:hypothetical protein